MLESIQKLTYTSHLGFTKQIWNKPGLWFYIWKDSLSHGKKGPQNSRLPGNLATCLKGGGEIKPLPQIHWNSHIAGAAHHTSTPAEALLVQDGSSCQRHSALSNKPTLEQELELPTRSHKWTRQFPTIFIPVAASSDNFITTDCNWDARLTAIYSYQALPIRSLENSSSLLQVTLVNIRVLIVWGIGFKFFIDWQMNCPPLQWWSASLETERSHPPLLKYSKALLRCTKF